MKNALLFRRGGPLGLPSLAIALLVGCASSQVETQPSAREVIFREQLVLTTVAIQNGDLEKAWTHVARARQSASTSDQKRKVEDLEHLIDGAEALRAGNPMLARSEWAKIEEPNLSREVRHKARLIGIHIPIVPLDETK